MIGIHFFILLSVYHTARGVPLNVSIPATRFARSVEECGKTRLSDQHGKRIIQGEVAALGQFPWAARIGYRIQKTKSIIFYCAGSLISNKFVISAAHCEEEGDLVRLGENDAATKKDCDYTGVCAPPHQDIDIKQYFFNKFCYATLQNDIVLIKLKKNAVFNDFVRPICLPKKELTYAQLMKETIWLCGWGRINPNYKTFSDQLLYITAPAVKPLFCNRLYRPSLRKSQLCIGYQRGKDTCEGDSGGPASVYLPVNNELRAHLVGIVSYGLEHCGDGPAVYTNVGRYLDWIHYTLEKQS